jgi:diaminopropionate ammonia-lyase
MSHDPARPFATDCSRLIDRMADPTILVLENPGYMPGRLGQIAARYAQEKDRIAAALEAAPGYALTPVHRLDRLADAVGCRRILFKDEGPRFGLGSFKSVGAVYAMIRHIERLSGARVDAAKALRGGYAKLMREQVFATATSGNHGRALAWVSQCVGARCIIYAPSECSEGRIEAMSKFGAEIVRTGLLYNPAMNLCRKDCRENGWTLFADTSWDDYQEIPMDIMLGYAHIVRELMTQFDDWPSITHIVIQGGVGAFAAGLLAGLSAVDPDARIQAIVVEPRNICALQTSARHRRPTAVKIETMSMMTGISNEEISVAAWSVLGERVRWFVGLSDAAVQPCLQYFHRGGLDGIAIEMGETASAGVATWVSLMKSLGAQAVGGGPESGAIVFGCEGVTDPAIYKCIVGE